MHNPFNKVKGRMTELEISQEKMSDDMGMSISTLNEKLNGYADFKFTELVKIAYILDIEPTEYQDYFFQYALRKRK